MDAIDRLRKLHAESREEPNAHPTMRVWSPAAADARDRIDTLLPLLLDELEAGRAVRAHEVAFRDAYTMHEWHMKAKRLALAYDAARAAADEEARKCDEPD